MKSYKIMKQVCGKYKRYNTKCFPTYEEARKAVRRLVTKLNGKYTDSYSSFGFKVERV